MICLLNCRLRTRKSESLYLSFTRFEHIRLVHVLHQSIYVPMENDPTVLRQGRIQLEVWLYAIQTKRGRGWIRGSCISLSHSSAIFVLFICFTKAFVFIWRMTLLFDDKNAFEVRLYTIQTKRGRGGLEDLVSLFHTVQSYSSCPCTSPKHLCSCISLSLKLLEWHEKVFSLYVRT